MQIILHKGSSQIGVTISQIISLLYFENVNLHSGFPCGEGGLIRSISVRLVPRQPRKKKDGGVGGGRHKKEGGRGGDPTR